MIKALHYTPHKNVSFLFIVIKFMPQFRVWCKGEGKKREHLFNMTKFKQFITLIHWDF